MKWTWRVHASSGVVEVECQQEAEAAHPAPAWGRWKWNASMKWKLPLRHCTVGSMPN